MNSSFFVLIFFKDIMNIILSIILSEDNEM